MVKTMINIRTDAEVKEKAQRVAKNLGFPLSTIINAYLKQFVREKEVRFSEGYQMTPKLEKLLDQVEKDIKNKRNIAGPFKNMDEAIKYLHS